MWNEIRRAWPPESRPQMGGRSVDSLARGYLVWAFDAGCLHTRLGVPSMGRIELAERSQPEEMTPTVAKRNAEPRGEGGKKRVANPWP